jgi:hypothetical protein
MDMEQCLFMVENKKLKEKLKEADEMAEFYSRHSNVGKHISIDDFDSFGVTFNYFSLARTWLRSRRENK